MLDLSVDAKSWIPPSGHFVRFYEEESRLLDEVAEFISAAWRRGGTGLVIGTTAHRTILRARLDLGGSHGRSADRPAGRLVMLDAEELLDCFMVDGWPDEQRFFASVGAAVGQGVDDGSPLHAYGEMVALLAEQGRHDAALHLEKLWNELARRHRFALFCAYPVTVFADAEQGSVFQRICREHTEVCRSEQVGPGQSAAEVNRLLAVWQQKATALQAEVDRRERAEAELRAVLQQREVLLQSLAEASSAKDELLAMLGHELRNPLSPIVTALQLMRMRGDTGTSREQAVIQRQVDHLSRLVDDLLDVSRIARGKIELKRAPVDLREVLERALQRSSPLLEQRGHRLTVNIDEALRCEGDAARLVQIVGHLLNNAARYTPMGGEIRLTAQRQPGGAVQIEVCDNGNGIAPEMLPRLFERFVQGRRSVQRSEGGLGLGLALVKSLAELHGGQVFAQSAGPGQGSCFRVLLPATPAQALQPANALAATAQPTGAPAPAAMKRRVLLVDDNVDAAETLGQFLRASGHEVQLAHDPVAALRMLDRFTPEVALLDIGLPVMDGYELGGRILQRVAGCRLIAISGYGQANDRQRSGQAGFECHLAKPVAPGMLAEVVGGRPGRPAGEARA